MLDSRPQSIHADTRQSGQLSTIAVPGRKEQGTSGHDSPRIWTGGCDKHPHSWPLAHGFPTFSCWAPLLSPAEGPVLCHPNHNRAAWMAGSSWPHSPWEGQRVGHLLYSGTRCTAKEDLGLYRCEGWASPSNKVLALLRQCAKYARALGLCYTGQDGDPASPHPT